MEPLKLDIAFSIEDSADSFAVAEKIFQGICPAKNLQISLCLSLIRFHELEDGRLSLLTTHPLTPTNFEDAFTRLSQPNAQNRSQREDHDNDVCSALEALDFRKEATKALIWIGGHASSFDEKNKNGKSEVSLESTMSRLKEQGVQIYFVEYSTQQSYGCFSSYRCISLKKKDTQSLCDQILQQLMTQLPTTSISLPIDSPQTSATTTTTEFQPKNFLSPTATFASFYFWIFESHAKREWWYNNKKGKIKNKFGLMWWTLQFLDAVLRAFGQVVFANSPLSGAIILAGLYVTSTWTASCSLIATLGATLTAQSFQLDKNMTQEGLHGYNAVLTGIGISMFMQDQSAQVALVCLVMGGFSVIIQESLAVFLGVFKCPVCTFPFNITAIMFLAATYGHANFPINPDALGPKTPLPSTPGLIPLPPYSAHDLFMGGLIGVSQVYFSENYITAILFLIGIFLTSPRAAAFAYLGSFVGACVGAALGASADLITSGLFGFNSCLGAMAIGAICPKLGIGEFVKSILSAALSGVLFSAFRRAVSIPGLPTFTFPFCFSALIFVMFESRVVEARTARQRAAEEKL